MPLGRPHLGEGSYVHISLSDSTWKQGKAIKSKLGVHLDDDFIGILLNSIECMGETRTAGALVFESDARQG